jgi:DNA-binding transcriptional LysR family regulator
MEIYQLKTFVAVAAEGNLTRAADRVFTSPPAVSAQLKALEDELGVRLFDRNSRGMSLTSAGEQLLHEAQRTIAAAQAMQAAAAGIRGQARGAVRMGSVSDPVSLRLGEVFVRLAQRHPQVALHLHQGVSVRTIQAVRRGELDCAYVLNAHEQQEGLEVVRLQPNEVVAVLPVNQAKERVPGTLAELVRLPWVTTPADCGLRWHLGQLFEAAGASLPTGAMADTEGMVRSMVASGIGAGLMRRDQAEEAQRQGQGVVWQGWTGKTWLCWISSASALRVPAVAAIREAVIDSWA